MNWNCILGWILLTMPMTVLFAGFFIKCWIDLGAAEAFKFIGTILAILAGVVMLVACIATGIKLIETCT